MNMKLWTLGWKKIKTLGGRNEKFSFSEENTIVWVTSLLIIIFLGTIAFDAQLFYQTVINQKTNTPLTTPASISPDKDLEEVIKILDERETKFKNILSGEPASTTSPREILSR